MLTTLLLIAVLGVESNGLTMKFIPDGVTAKVGGYRPIRAEMDGEASSVKKAPEGLDSPKFGEIKIGEKSWHFILDEPDGKPAKLFVDTNGDGDLTNDPATTWDTKTSLGMTMQQGKSQIDLGGGNLGTLGMYRFDPKDPRRAALKNTMLYYTDFGYEVTMSLDGKSFTSFVAGRIEPKSSLWIDRDGNKKVSYKRETVHVGKPFNFTGTTYVIAIDGDGAKLDVAAEKLPEMPLPPDISVGKKAVTFTMDATDGTPIDFPKTYTGKIVMLDFWATWCGPCIAELPNVKKAYEEWHDKGFEILGVSFDAEGMTDKLAEFTKEKEMPWRQLYEGKSWETTIGELYDVNSIPFVVLVDGDSGEILATTQELRGPGLTSFIGKMLEKKNASK